MGWGPPADSACGQSGGDDDSPSGGDSPTRCCACARPRRPRRRPGYRTGDRRGLAGSDTLSASRSHPWGDPDPPLRAPWGARADGTVGVLFALGRGCPQGCTRSHRGGQVIPTMLLVLGCASKAPPEVSTYTPPPRNMASDRPSGVVHDGVFTDEMHTFSLPIAEGWVAQPGPETGLRHNIQRPKCSCWSVGSVEC